MAEIVLNVPDISCDHCARTIDQTLATVGRKLGLKAIAVELADPLAAVDVDKPADHALVEAILEGKA